VELVRELGYSATPEEILSRLDVTCSKTDQAVFVAEGESIVGWIQVSRTVTIEGGFGSEILGLVVTRPHRQSGIGRILVEAAESWAIGHGCARMRVRSNIVREDAHDFYFKLGYAVSKTQSVFDKGLPAAT
jgi:GNAT superfamily N-acetyltransferase